MCPTTCTCVLIHVHLSSYMYMCPTTCTCRSLSSYVYFFLIFFLCIQVLCTKYIKGEDQLANLANTKVTLTKLRSKHINMYTCTLNKLSPPPPPPPHTHHSLIAAVAAYFIIGAIVMYTVKGARGVEVVPNFTFWKTLPLLIKVG